MNQNPYEPPTVKPESGESLTGKRQKKSLVRLVVEVTLAFIAIAILWQAFWVFASSFAK